MTRIESIHLTFNYDSKTTISEEYAYQDGHLYELKTSHYGIRQVSITHLEKEIKKSYLSSKLGKYFFEEKFCSSSRKRLFKNVEITVDRQTTKEIMGYSCYLIRIHAMQLGVNGQFDLFVTDALSHLPIQHKIQRQFPEITAFPLEIISKEFYSATLSQISETVGLDVFEIEEAEYILAEDPETGFSLIRQLTGLRVDDFRKKMLSYFS